MHNHIYYYQNKVIWFRLFFTPRKVLFYFTFTFFFKMNKLKYEFELFGPEYSGVEGS
jgi:hypothetical protein